jgi:hypothetical protein
LNGNAVAHLGFRLFCRVGQRRLTDIGEAPQSRRASALDLAPISFTRQAEILIARAF